jgi:hypothetical protein
MAPKRRRKGIMTISLILYYGIINWVSEWIVYLVLAAVTPATYSWMIYTDLLSSYTVASSFSDGSGCHNMFISLYN